MRPVDLELAAPAGWLVTAIGFEGLAPQGLIGIEVWSGGQSVYRLHGHIDSRGMPIPAGDLIDAMGRMAGRSDLALDLGPDGVPAAGLHLRLWLAEGQQTPRCTPR